MAKKIIYLNEKAFLRIQKLYGPKATVRHLTNTIKGPTETKIIYRLKK